MKQETQIVINTRKWIANSKSPEQIENIKNFIDRSHISYAHKQELYAFADGRKEAQLHMPYFKIIDGIAYYTDNDFNIKDFSTRWKAVCTMFRLVMKGFDVYLMETSEGWNIVTDLKKQGVHNV